MHVVGLTGGIASGKSTVSHHLAKLGAIILDADKIAREIVAPGKPALKELVEEFGSNILQPDNTLDRSQLAQIIFNNPQKRQRLNEITHPKIIAELRKRLAELREQYDCLNKVVVIDAALLVEAGLVPLVEEVWLVMVDVETQLQRLIQRDNLTREAAEARLKSQMPLEQRLVYANRIIQNTSSIEATQIQVNELWNNLIYMK